MSRAASEREVGFLHALINKVHTRRLERMIEQMEGEKILPEFAIDEKYMRVVQKWVLDNGITAAPDADQGNNALTERVAAIRGKMKGNVLDFKAEANERGIG